MDLNQYVRLRLRAPLYNSADRTWDVEYLEKDGWQKKSFNNWSQAYNFYMDKWDFHQYWFETTNRRIR